MSEQTQSPQSSSQSGQMTAVMAAVSTGGEKALRLGLVRDGRVLEERVLRERQPVSVGSSEKNLFVVTEAGLPSRFRLFDVEDGRYVLQFTERMAGKLSTPSGVRELEDLRGQADEVEGVFRVPLHEEARGKLTIGGTSFLFQFVAPPPVQPKPQLPVSVTRGAVGIDWTTTMIAAFSFLIHFMAIGAVYSDWLDPVVDYDVNVANIVEAVKSMPPPPEVEQKNVEEQDKPDKKVEEKVEDQKPVKKAAEKAPPTDTGKRRLSAVEAAALSEELDSFDMGILGVNLGRTATADVLSSSDNIATGIMDQAAESGAGVSSGGPGGLKLGSAGGAIRPGETGASLGSIGSTGKTSEGGSGAVKKVKGPTGNASVGGANVAGGKVTNASQVVARMRAGFRACYTRGLANNPDIQGRVTLTLRVGPGGEVTAVSAASSGNLPSDVVSCIKSRASAGRFAPPEGGAAAITVPVVLVAQ